MQRQTKTTWQIDKENFHESRHSTNDENDQQNDNRSREWETIPALLEIIIGTPI